jgi:hypothetical protein
MNILKNDFEKGKKIFYWFVELWIDEQLLLLWLSSSFDSMILRDFYKIQKVN